MRRQQRQTRHCSGGTVSKRRRGRLENKRAACEWERGRSGQGKYNEEASGSWVVNAWGSGRSRSARDADKQYAGGGRGRWARSGGKALRGASCRGRGVRGQRGPRANQKSVTFEFSLLRFMWRHCGLLPLGLGGIRTTEPNVRLSLFGLQISKMKKQTGIRTIAHSVLLFKSPLNPKEGVTWS